MMIRTAIEQGNGRHLLEPVLEAMTTCGSLEWTRQRSGRRSRQSDIALQILPDTPWREALIGLAHRGAARSLMPFSYPAYCAGYPSKF